MLEIRDLQFTIRKDGADIPLLQNISVKIPSGHFVAIVGPSGCGKSTLLKTIAGINVESGGDLHWDGRNLSEDGDLQPDEFGYVPQFSIAFDELTVEESIDNAIQLRLKTRSQAEVEQIADRIIEEVGLDAIRERRVAVLSGGQKRRLGLALEMATAPRLLLCDEVTSGLDPKSESEIVNLLHRLSKSGDRIVASVTHSLGHLDLYDSVLVLYAGRVVYHGPPSTLAHYFGVALAEEVYPSLATREPEQWAQSWQKHREAYYAAMPGFAAPAPQPAAGDEASAKRAGRPDFFTQLFVLLGRRWTIFFRDRTQLLLQVAMLLIFPAVVVLFALDGVPSLKRASENRAPGLEQEMKEKIQIAENRAEVGGLLSGLVMFQVVLLALMGSNNSAREIAAERLIFEKEKLGGLRISSYLGSKLLFLAVLVTVQSVWMYLFVNIFAQVPAAPLVHAGLLILVNAAMTAVCLGISAAMGSPDQASLLSIYLVGFQLPLSGAVLALPSAVEPLIQPFISAYWSWSGIVRSLEDRFFAAVDTVTEASLRPAGLCFLVLTIHLVFGVILSFAGAARSRWSH
ncbi:MAG: ABC-type multidrug transport system, ATPase component [Verrucomicrobia bacterium]|nr:MAG: ABC-type multidrug transport system, ATPase component [Verrucomicrobiota bacterium]